MEHPPNGPLASWEHAAAAQKTLALLSRRTVLIAVTLQTWVAGRQFDITVSKGLDEAGQWTGQYWWDVDRSTADGMGRLSREKRWALAFRSYNTAEAAYEAAVQAMERGIGGLAVEQAAGANTGVTAQPA